jgi:predicted ATPase
MFAGLMLGWELRSWHETSALDGPVLMGRGIADVVGYLTLCGLPVPDHVEAAARTYRYNHRVFIAPYWDTIYGRDAERKQDQKEAKATGSVMARTYSRLGYQLVELPKVTIEERADFVMNRLKSE